MAMLYGLHTQNQSQFVYTCNNCKKNVETRYHCHTCDDFDLCISCYAKEGHPHKMDRLGLGLDEGVEQPADHKTNPQEGIKLSNQRCIQSLVHACQCYDANCRLPSCQSMKRVVQHIKACKTKVNGNCPICKQLMASCFYHAKYCTDAKCAVPVCSSIKQKIKMQQHLARLQQQQLRNRMAAMNSRLHNASGPSTSGVLSPGSSVQNASTSSSHSLTQQHLPHAAGMDVEPGALTLPASVLQSNLQNQAPGGVLLDPASNSVMIGVSQSNLQNQSSVGNVIQQSASSQASNKEWQGQVNQELREHLIRKLIQAILTSYQIQVGQGAERNFALPDFNRRSGIVIEDRIMQNLETYARKVENDIFETATSKSEYYHLLAGKYYKIQKELDERKQRRRGEQQQRRQQQRNQSPARPVRRRATTTAPAA